MKAPDVPAVVFMIGKIAFVRIYLRVLASSISFLMSAILFFNSELSFSGIFFTFLRSKESTIEDTPIIINEIPVITTREIPDISGLTTSMKEKIVPRTLKIAVLPKLRIPKLFISKENPRRRSDKKSKVNPTTKGNMTMDIPG